MIGIVVSTFNKPITDGLLNGCIKSLKENGYKNNQINIRSSRFSSTIHVPVYCSLVRQMHPGSIDKNYLVITYSSNTQNLVTSRLRFPRSDTELKSEQLI